MSRQLTSRWFTQVLETRGSNGWRRPMGTILSVFYTMVKNQVEYDDTIWATRDIKLKWTPLSRPFFVCNKLSIRRVCVECGGENAP